MRNSLKREEVFNKIKEKIIYGGYFPGERLREQDLVKEFGSNRLHIREALIRLNEERLLEVIPNQGAMVGRLSLQEIQNSYGVIAQLEVFAAELALPLVNSRNLNELVGINRRLKEYMLDRQYSSYIKENLDFHIFLAQISGNDILIDLITNLRNRNLKYSYHILYVSDYGEEYIKQHDDIIEACKSQKVSGVSEAIRKHIFDVRDHILNDFKRRGHPVNLVLPGRTVESARSSKLKRPE